MFFFFKESVDDVFKYFLKVYLNAKFKTIGYCDIEELFKPNESIISKAKKTSPNVAKLYKHRVKAKKEADLDYLPQIFYDYINKHSYQLASNENIEDSYSVLVWIMGIWGSNKKDKEQIISDFIKYANSVLENKIGNIGTVVYDTEKIEAHNITSVNDYLKVLKACNADTNEFFYRGHQKVSYILEPSIMRNPGIYENEKCLYQDLIINCPKNFLSCHAHIDYLVEMQHYGLPTRLLDITRNPLVALYFASDDNNNNTIGEIIVFKPDPKEIKYYNSDVVSMLSSLPLFSKAEQDELAKELFKPHGNQKIVERFIHEIKTEKPSFENRIIPDDIGSCFIVLPKKDNDRIIKQDGAFIICGVLSNISEKINDKLRLKSGQKSLLLCVTNKKEILKELDLLSINKSTLFPEIDNVSEYICKKYKN